jgi:hypothetical protein
MQESALGRRTALRAGLIVEGETLPAWAAAAASRLAAVEGVELAAVLELPAEQPAPGPSLTDRLLARLEASADSLRRVAVDDVAPGVARLRCRGQRDPDSNTLVLNAADVEATRGYGVDVLLKLGGPALRGDVLTSASLGVWAFEHAEQDEPWGTTPALRAIAGGHSAATSALRCLTGDARRTPTLFRGWLKVERYSYAATLDRLLFASARWPADRARALLAGASIPEPAADEESPRGAQGRPSLPVTTMALLRERAARLAGRVRKLLYEEQWSIGIAPAPIERVLDDRGFAASVEWMPEPDEDLFIADPFALRSNGGVTILAEEYSRTTGLGIIRELEFTTGSGFRSAGVSIAGAHHLSYPFVVEDGGQTYVVPETADALEVALYELQGDSWVRVETLVEGRDLVDPSLVKHGDRWWLWAADREIDEWAALTLWHAPSLRGPWVEHPISPVKVDVRAGRPGGTPFVHQGKLYRPAQDCAESYGARTVINEVTELTAEAYSEQVTTTVAPVARGPYSRGLHTVSRAGAVTLVDGKRLRRRDLRSVARMVTRRLLRR